MGIKPVQENAQTTTTSGLHEAQIIYLRKIEKENYERAMKLKRLKRNNTLTGFCLAGSVLGIYLYSILAVKQEHFLDEIDVKSNEN